MIWILLSLLSAVLLGLYDAAKKSAVHNNAVAPVLFFNVLTAALLWAPWVVLSIGYRGFSNADSWAWFGNSVLYVPPLELRQHLLVMVKALLVGISWTLAFVALRRLPVSIAAPIRATSPVWTITIAVLWMGERLTLMQWLGVSIILLAFFAFSQLGKSEGIHFHRDRGVVLMMIATLLGAISAAYDKYLLQTIQILPATLQAWFSIYLVLVMLPWCSWWFLRERHRRPFSWRWSIPLIAIFLLAADLTYFTAISFPGAKIAIISPVRRTSVIVSYLFGILWFGEPNWRRKGVCVAVLLVGVFILGWAKI